mgnify:CR=1 FL=1
MKKRFLFVILVVFVFLLVGCGVETAEITPTNTPVNTTEVDAIRQATRTAHKVESNARRATNEAVTMEPFQTWVVTKSTFLYRHPDADSDSIATLSVGTRVRDSGGKDNLENCFVTEGIEVCEVSVIDSHQSGYVIRKWLKKD